MIIEVFLTSGSVHRYEQKDPAMVHRNLSRIAPDKLFTEPTITIGGDYHATAFAGSAVLRVELTSLELPDWDFGANLTRIRLISEDEFLAHVRHFSEDESRRRDRPIAAGVAFVVHGKLEDRAGAWHYIEAEGKALPDVARRRSLTRLLQSPAIHARRGENTAVVFNPANVVCVSAYPGAPELPVDALLGHYRP